MEHIDSIYNDIIGSSQISACFDNIDALSHSCRQALYRRLVMNNRLDIVRKIFRLRVERYDYAASIGSLFAHGAETFDRAYLEKLREGGLDITQRIVSGGTILYNACAQYKGREGEEQFLNWLIVDLSMDPLDYVDATESPLGALDNHEYADTACRLLKASPVHRDKSVAEIRKIVEDEGNAHCEAWQSTADYLFD